MSKITGIRVLLGVTVLGLTLVNPNPAWAGQILLGDQYEAPVFGANTLYQIDPSSGATVSSVPITNTNNQPLWGLTSDGAGDLFALLGSGSTPDLLRINQTSGAGTVLGSLGVNLNERYLNFDPVTHVLYAGTDFTLYTLNPNTGAATLVENITGSNQVTAMAIDSNGNAYIADTSETLYSLNLTNGQATSLGTVTGGANGSFFSLAFDQNNNLYGVNSNSGYLEKIDLSTLTATVIPNQATIDGIAFVTPAAAVPEPSSLTLLGIGSAGLVGFAWRSRRRGKRQADRLEPVM